jgi:hypothetical protein
MNHFLNIYLTFRLKLSKLNRYSLDINLNIKIMKNEEENKLKEAWETPMLDTLKVNENTELIVDGKTSGIVMS